MFMVVRYDRESFEYLSGESLWSSREAIYFATNYEMNISNFYKDDYWWNKFREVSGKYDKLLLELCNTGKLTAYTDKGTKGLALVEQEYTEMRIIYGKHGEAVNAIKAIKHGDVYFCKAELLEALKEYGIEVDGNNLWASFEKKDKALRPEQETKLIVQGIGIALWAADPTMTIADMAKHELVKKYGGEEMYTEKTRRRWLSEVDDRSPDQKTGPKPKDS